MPKCSDLNRLYLLFQQHGYRYSRLKKEVELWKVETDERIILPSTDMTEVAEQKNSSEKQKNKSEGLKNKSEEQTFKQKC